MLRDDQRRPASSEPRKSNDAVAFTKLQGVTWTGLPLGIGLPIWSHIRQHGLSLETFFNVDFAIDLTVSIVVVGFLGGILFSWLVNRAIRSGSQSQ